MENRWSPGQVNVRNGLGATARLRSRRRNRILRDFLKRTDACQSRYGSGSGQSSQFGGLRAIGPFVFDRAPGLDAGRARVESQRETDYLLMMINDVPTFVSTMMMPLSISEADIFGM
jgi:hypothetical protein